MTELIDRVRTALAGHYRVERELGRGGMAIVFLAEDLKHRRWVAVKVLRPELAAAVGPGRFLREIAIVAPLTHPHVLPLHDSGEAGGFLYYVMPYVEGESLRERLQRGGALPLDEALHVTRDVAEALGHAHGRGVVHRDIKPANILLEGGHAVIADFGIAVALSSLAGARVTEPGVYLGTPEYMSPEQIFGEEQLDGRSDQYSLACVLYEMLAGQPPFVGPNARAVFARQATDSVVPVTKVRPDVPVSVAAVLERALAKQPADRYPTMPAFAEALTAPAAEPVPADRRSIAVLAFANLSPDPENDYLSDGISEEIITALGKVAGFRVAARSSSFAFKDKPADVRAIARQLRVQSVLEGSVRRAGDRLRVTAQLIDASDGCHLWAERYDRDMADVFAIQDEIAGNVARALQVVLSDEERRRIRGGVTADVQAYDLYLRGRQFVRLFSKKGMLFARQLFARAIEVDARYARAHAGVADCCSFLYLYFDRDPALPAEAETASRRALEFDPELAEAHASRGLAFSLSGRYDEAEGEFHQAIRLSPRLFEAHYFYARSSFQAGRYEEAAREFERACEVREDYHSALLAAQAWQALGRKDVAREAYDRALAITARHVELNPDDFRALALGAGVAVRCGERERGLAWVRRAVTGEPDDAAVLYAAACTYALLEMPDDSLGLLARALQTGFGNREWIANDPDFASLRDDPRFRAIVERL